jgi:hypothetical protein
LPKEIVLQSKNIIEDDLVVNVETDSYSSHSCLLEMCVIPGNLKIIHALVKKKFKLESIVDIRGKEYDVKITTVGDSVAKGGQ